MNDQQKLTLWLGATRYYLGRMSYAVSDYCDLLIQSWGDIPKNTQKLIERDIEEAFTRDEEREGGYSPLGMDCDKQQWERVRRLWRN